MSANILTRPVPLSGRLKTIVELAGSGKTVCDVGCDHAHVPIRLLQTGQYERAIGMDLLPGPLGKAAGNLALYGMADRVELRLSDGMDALLENEAETVVITGMGGTLMRGILLRDPEKTQSVQKLVLGPQSDPDRVRSALRRLGFTIEEERLIYSDGKYYPVLRAARAGAGICKSPFPADVPAGIRQEAEDLFGPVLLARRDLVLKEFLVRQAAVLEKILCSINTSLRKMEDDGKGADRKQALQKRHLARKKELEHSLILYRAALRVYDSPA